MVETSTASGPGDSVIVGCADGGGGDSVIVGGADGGGVLHGPEPAPPPQSRRFLSYFKSSQSGASSNGANSSGGASEVLSGPAQLAKVEALQQNAALHGLRIPPLPIQPIHQMRHSIFMTQTTSPVNTMTLMMEASGQMWRML